MTAPVLELRDVSAAYGPFRALFGVSLTVGRGEAVALVGSNGSGKTTTARVASGLVVPTSGSVVVDGVDVTGKRTYEVARAGVAHAPEGRSVFATLSVADNIEVGIHSTLSAHRPFRNLSHLFLLRWVPLLGELVVAIVGTPASRRERTLIDATVETEIHRFEARLGPRRDDPAYSLSYANRRRTEIARALALQPKLLVLDEPTAGMNQSETAEVLDQLLELKAEGQAILLVEHKLDLVMTVSDRVIVMDGGWIIAQGRPEEVRQAPAVIEAYLGRRRGLGGEDLA